MDPTWEELAENDNEEESSGFEHISFSRDGLVFLIDSSESMFDDSEESPFQLSVKCAYTTLTNKIICSERDVIAVVLFGTEKEKNPSGFKHIYIFQDLEQPGAEKILQMKKLLNYSAENFKEEYGHSNDYSLSDALWTCASLFSACKQKLSHRQVLLFTNVDDPHAGNPALERQAITKAKDLFDLGIEVELMHIQREKQGFDVNKFYKDILCFFSEDENAKLPDPAEKFDELLTRIRAKDHRKNNAGHINFVLGENLKIAVNVYNLVRPTYKPSNIKLCKTTNAELKSMTKHYRADTAEILLPSDLKKFQEYAGKCIYMETDELRQMKNFGEPALTLLGFKPISCLKKHHYIRPAQFIYPDEHRVVGSIRLFSALLQQCQTRKYVPICKLISRNNDTPKLAALLPQEEELDDHGIQETPPGFHIIFLPFMEEIRKLSLKNKQNPKEALIDKAKEIIKKLQFRFHPESFENPVLQQHWRNVEALALDQDAPDDMTDYTMPDYKTMEQRAGKLVEELKVMGFEEGYEAAIAGKKRGAASAGGGVAAKKARQDDGKVTVDIKKEAEAKTLERLTVSVLREFCRNHGIKCGSRKADITEVIYRYFNVS